MCLFELHQAYYLAIYIMHIVVKPGVGLVVRVAAWDPRVLSSSPVGRWIKIHQEVDSACHPSEVSKMSTSVLVRGTLYQRHSRVPTNNATSSHRLHSMERDRAFQNRFWQFPILKSANLPLIMMYWTLVKVLLWQKMNVVKRWFGITFNWNSRPFII